MSNYYSAHTRRNIGVIGYNPKDKNGRKRTPLQTVAYMRIVCYRKLKLCISMMNLDTRVFLPEEIEEIKRIQNDLMKLVNSKNQRNNLVRKCVEKGVFKTQPYEEKPSADIPF